MSPTPFKSDEKCGPNISLKTKFLGLCNVRN